MARELRYCAARVDDRRSCLHNPKDVRFGLGVCGVHAAQIDRYCLKYGAEYALSFVWHYWDRPEAAFPVRNQSAATVGAKP